MTPVSTASDASEGPDSSVYDANPPPAMQPPHTERLMMLLSARHPDGLPNATLWADLPDAANALRWIVEHAPINLQRERALIALRHYPSEVNKSLLMTYALASGFHHLIRAGAMYGLTGQNLSAENCSAIRNLHTHGTKSLDRARTSLLDSACSL